MSKIALAFGSFIVGACCGSMALSLIQTSTRVHAFQSRGVVVEGAEPVVPPIGPAIKQVSLVGFAEQPLDGINCNGCTLAPGKFTYAGGAYQLQNARLSKNVPIELRGAALNTINLLRALGALPGSSAPVPSPPPKKDKPSNKRNELELKAQSSFTLISLEGVKK